MIDRLTIQNDFDILVLIAISVLISKTTVFKRPCYQPAVNEFDQGSQFLLERLETALMFMYTVADEWGHVQFKTDKTYFFLLW